MTETHDGTDGIDYEKAQEGAQLLLEAVGQDPTTAPFRETWERRVPETLATLTAGGRPEEKPTIRTFDTGVDTNQTELVVKSDIPFYSLCQHHLLPYIGEATVAYRPDGAIVGLSKLTRYLRWQGRQLTTQESVTDAIATGLAEELGAPVVMVEVAAVHLCEAMRGVTERTITRTRAVVGSPTATEQQRFSHATSEEIQL